MIRRAELCEALFSVNKDWASQILPLPPYNPFAAQYTRSPTNHLLSHAGSSFNYDQYLIPNPHGLNTQPFTPECFAGASRRDASLGTLTNGLSEYVTTTGTEGGIMAAISVFTLIPALIVFGLVQKHIVAGLTFGAVKG